MKTVYRYDLGEHVREDRARNEDEGDVINIPVPADSQILKVWNPHPKRGPVLHALVDTERLEQDQGPLRVWIVPTGMPIREDVGEYVDSFHQLLQTGRRRGQPRFWHVFRLKDEAAV